MLAVLYPSSSATFCTVSPSSKRRCRASSFISAGGWRRCSGVLQPQKQNGLPEAWASSLSNYIASDGVQDSQEAPLSVSPIGSLHILQKLCDTVILNTSFPAPSDGLHSVQLFVRTPIPGPPRRLEENTHAAVHILWGKDIGIRQMQSEETKKSPRPYVVDIRLGDGYVFNRLRRNWKNDMPEIP